MITSKIICKKVVFIWLLASSIYNTWVCAFKKRNNLPAHICGTSDWPCRLQCVTKRERHATAVKVQTWHLLLTYQSGWVWTSDVRNGWRQKPDICFMLNTSQKTKRTRKVVSRGKCSRKLFYSMYKGFAKVKQKSSFVVFIFVHAWWHKSPKRSLIYIFRSSSISSCSTAEYGSTHGQLRFLTDYSQPQNKSTTLRGRLRVNRALGENRKATAFH